MTYAKSIIIDTLIVSFLIMFYPSYSYSYLTYSSYPYLGFNNTPEEKNNNSELLNKMIEPTINSVSLNKVDIDIDDKDVVCYENDDDEIVCFDKDDLDGIDIDDLNINDNNDQECFENDDDETVCFDKNAINNDDSIFIID